MKEGGMFLPKDGRNELLRGSITRNVWSLAMPMMFGNMLQTAFNIVDMIWVGKLGGAAIAAKAWVSTWG